MGAGADISPRQSIGPRAAHLRARDRRCLACRGSAVASCSRHPPQPGEMSHGRRSGGFVETTARCCARHDACLGGRGRHRRSAGRGGGHVRDVPLDDLAVQAHGLVRGGACHAGAHQEALQRAIFARARSDPGTNRLRDRSAVSGLGRCRARPCAACVVGSSAPRSGGGSAHTWVDRDLPRLVGHGSGRA